MKILKSKIIVPLLILAFIVLLIFLNIKGWLNQPKNIFYTVSRPFLKAGQWLGNKISDALSFFVVMGQLAKENQFLKNENQKLFLENTQLKDIAIENEILRRQLDFSLPEKKTLILANIIGRYSGAQEYSFLIDRGKEDGVSVNQPIVAGGGYLVGKITEVSKNTAKALLIVDSKSIVNVRVQETRASGAVRGEHGLSIVMEMISQEHKIKQGELVITSGLGGIFPKGLLVGEIEEIISAETEVFKKARLRPLVDFNKLEMVFVIK